MKLYDRKLSWKIFCLIGQGRTLSHAAQECGIDLPYASRLISKLEDELGFFLVLHRPRPMKLSENGIKIFRSLKNSLPRKTVLKMNAEKSALIFRRYLNAVFVFHCRLILIRNLS